MAEKEPKKRGGCLKNIMIAFGVLILFGACSAIFSSGDDVAESEKDEDAVTVAELEEKEEAKERRGIVSSDDEDSEDEPEEETEVVEEENKEPEEVEEDLKPEDDIKRIITEVISDENISQINVAEHDTGFDVDVTFSASDNFTTNMIANGIKRNIVDATLNLQASEYNVTYLLYIATLPLTDNMGNEEDGQVMSASFYGETIDALNPDNELFLYENLESAADGYSEHPDFRE